MPGENLLSDKQVRTARAAAKPYNLRDGGSLFGRVINTQGRASVSWHFYFKWLGKTERMTIGHYPEVTLQDARTRRNEARTLLAGDPPMHPVMETRRRRNDLRAEEQAAALEKTVKSLFEDWQSVHLKHSRKDGGEDVRQFFEKNVFPYVGSIKARDIRRSHVTQLIDKVLARKARRTANVLLALLKQMFAHGVVRGLVDVNPTADFSKKHAGGKEPPRTRVLSPDEITDLLARLPKAGLSESMQAAIRLLLTTGVRVGELSAATWDEIDLDAATWVIPASHTKSQREHVVHLSEFAKAQIAVLDSLRENKYLLAGRNPKEPISDKSIAKATRDRQRAVPLKNRTVTHIGALKLTGGDWSPHDLRRTMATRMGDLGVAPHVVEKCLNHAMAGMMRVYNLQAYLPERRAAFDAWGSQLHRLSSGKPMNVIPIKRRAK